MMSLLSSLVFFVGGASAAFLDETAARLPALSDQSYVLAVGDADGVNGPDMLVANNGQSRLLINNGAGNFADETGGRIPALSTATIAAKFVDVDGDGDFDLFLVNVSGPNVLLINNGSGLFSDESSSRLPPDTGVGADIAVGDIDGNGSYDIVIAQRDSQNQILVNNGSGFFADESASRLPVGVDPSHGVLLVDVNGNGALDLFVASHEAQNRLYINNALGVFSDATAATLPALPDGGLRAAAADVDGDGDQDIVVAAGADGVKLLLNNGGVFTAGVLPTVSEFSIDVAVGDIDFDGTTDIAVANAGQDRVLLNDGAGTFSDATGAMAPTDDRRSFGNVLFDADGDFDLDLAVATPGGQNRFYANDIQVPRVRISIAPDFIEELDPVTITVESFDEDGVASTVVTVNGPGAVDQVVTLTGGSGTFTPPADGQFVVTVVATDGLGNATTRIVSFTADQKDLTPPNVTLIISSLSPLSGQTVGFDVTVIDPSGGGVISSGIASTSLTINGGNVPLDSAGRGSFATSALGVHSVVASSTDNSGNVGTDVGSFTVLVDDAPPVVGVSAAPNPVDITNPVTISVTATDNVQVSSLTATITGRDPDGAGPDAPVAVGSGVVLDGSGQGSYTPFLPGTYTVEAVALDPSGNSTTGTTTFVAAGDPDVTPPVVSIAIAPRNVAIGDPVTITVNATDDINVQSVALTINGTPVALAPDNSVVFTPPIVGSYTVNASALDPTGNEGTATAAFETVDPALDTTPPTVAITSPVDDAEVTDRVDIIGTATDLTFVSYKIEVAPVGTTDFTQVATGNLDVVDGVLGSFDPTLLTNGFYTLRLTAADINGRTASVTSVVSVAGALKLGQFAVSFLDKALNIGKLPLDVTREYDSRNRNKKGDFGFGWSIKLSGATLTENRSPSDNWSLTSSHSGIFPTFFLNPTRPHTVSIKFSEEDEGKIKFRAKPNPDQQAIVPIQILNGMNYVEIGEANGTLTPSSSPDWFLSGQILNGDFTPYNPGSFTYNGDDGFSYQFTEISHQSLRHKLTRITNPSGTTIDLTPNGFVRSDGLSLNFVRDGEGRITQVTDPRGNSILYEYDVAGDLVAVTDPEGNRSTFVYDSNHFLLEIHDPLGRITQRQEYNDDGRLIAITDSAGNRIEMEYDIAANTQIIRDRRGNPKIYEYDSRGKVVRQTEFPTVNGAVQAIEILRTYNADSEVVTETDANGVVTNFTYSAKGKQLSKVRDVGGLNLTSSFTYDAVGRVLTQVDERDNAVVNTYDSDGNRTSRTSRDGALTLFAYDSARRVARATGPLGNYTTFQYDSLGRKIVEERFAVGDVKLRRMEFTYDANGNKLSESVIVTTGGTPTALTTTFEYNANDQPITETDPLGNVKRIEYNPLGKKVAEIDALTNRTEFQRDSRSEITRVDFPDGTFELTGYDPDGNRNSTTDRDGNTTTFSYDALNRVTTIVYADGASRTQFYDPVGNVIGAADELGIRTDHTYDSVGRRLSTLQPSVFDAVSSGNLRPLTRYEYDANGNRTAVIDALGARTEFTYDPENRLTQTLFPDGNSESSIFDPLGHEISRTDAGGLTTAFLYDALDRLVLVRLPRPTALDARPETAYAYDEASRMIGQTDANGNATIFEYDAASRKTARELPGGQRETFGYDAAGRLASRTDFNGDTTLYTYNAVGRATLVEYAGGASVATTYTGGGQPLLVTDARGDTAYLYDNRNRLVRRTDPSGRAVSYAYHPTGQQASVTGPDGDATVYTYDALNRLATSVDPDGGVTTHEYDAIGNLAVVTRPNGTVTVNTYNVRDQLTDVSSFNGGGVVLDSHAYTLNANGLRTRVVELSGAVVDYVYDDNYRLVGETRTGADAFVSVYTYDAVGNRTSVDQDGVVTTSLYDSNDRLTSSTKGVVTTVYTYDANGNRIRTDDGVNVATFAYDAANRLVQGVAPGGATTVFEYDAAGNRVRKSDGASVTHYVIDVRSNTGVAQVIEERDGLDAQVVSYSYGLDLNSQKRGLARSYYHYDGLGSTRLLTDAAQTVTDSYTFDAYGNSVTVVGGTPNNYLFAGEQFDPNVGLYYLRARYYDQTTGRFVGMDPAVGDPMSPISLHRYLYANNNPVNFVDPTGEFSLISVSISISISSNIRSIYTQNLIKFFIKAVKISFCTLEPAYRMQSLGFSMMAQNVPGGIQVATQGQKQIAAGFEAIRSEIGSFYENVANDIVDVKFEVGGLLSDLYDSYTSGSPPTVAVPVPQEVQKLLDFKNQLDGWMDDLAGAMNAIDSLQAGDNCGAFTFLADKADDIAGLIPDF